MPVGRISMSGQPLGGAGAMQQLLGLALRAGSMGGGQQQPQQTDPAAEAAMAELLGLRGAPAGDGPGLLDEPAEDEQDRRRARGAGLLGDGVDG